MSRLTIIVAVFVCIGVAAAFPDLQVRVQGRARTKRASGLLKSKFLDLGVRDKLDVLEKLLRRQGDMGEGNQLPENANTQRSTGTGQSQGGNQGQGHDQGGDGGKGQNQGQGHDQGGGDGQGQNQGQGHDQGSGAGQGQSKRQNQGQGQSGKERCGIPREEHIYMYFVDAIGFEDPVQELTDQLVRAVDAMMDVTKDCTDDEDVFSDDDREGFEQQAKDAFGDIDSSDEVYWAGLLDLKKTYEENYATGKQAAENSSRWSPICSKMIEALHEEVGYLSEANQWYRWCYQMGGYDPLGALGLCGPQ